MIQSLIIGDYTPGTWTARKIASEVHSYVSEGTKDGLELLRLLKSGIIILLSDDLLFIHEIRKKVKIPLIVLTPDSRIPFSTTAAACLCAGADDVQPFNIDPRELIARVQTVVRRSQGRVDNIIQVGPMILDLNKHRVTINNAKIPFTVQEWDFLHTLAIKAGATVSKDSILNTLYGVDTVPYHNPAEVLASKVRKKLGSYAFMVKTVYGFGYMLRAEIQ